MTAQVRVEILNATNGPTLAGASNSVDQSSYGRINRLRGYSRLWQLKRPRFSWTPI